MLYPLQKPSKTFKLWRYLALLPFFCKVRGKMGGRVTPSVKAYGFATFPKGTATLSVTPDGVPAPPKGGALFVLTGNGLALSVFASQIHLSQRERPWQRDEVCGDCQGLSLWESWRVAPERARTLAELPLPSKPTALPPSPRGRLLAVAGTLRFRRERARPLRLLTAFASTSPKGRGLGKEMKFAGTAKGSPFGRAGA